MRTRRLAGAASAAILALLLATGAALADAQETVTRTFEAGADARLRLKNVNGDVRIEAGAGDRFEVTAVKTADKQERLADIEIRFDASGGDLEIEVKHEQDGWSRRYSAGSVEFTIRVPRGADLDGVELVNGDLEVRGVNGDVRAASVNGDVSGEDLGGNVALSTVNGGVSLVASGRPDSIGLSSVNGAVELVLPADADASIEASTVHGEIRGTGGLEVKASKWVGSSLNGKIGKGAGTRIELETVNGSIEIRRAGE